MKRWALALGAVVVAVTGGVAHAAPAPQDLPATLVATLPGFERPTDRAVVDVAGVYGAAAPAVVAGHVRTWSRSAGPVSQTVLAVTTRLRDDTSAQDYVRAFVESARASGGTLLAVPGLPGVPRVSWAGAGERRFDALVLRRGSVAVSLSFTPAGLFDDPTLRAIALEQTERLRVALPGEGPESVAPERVAETASTTRILGSVLPIVVVLGMVGTPIGVVVLQRRRHR